MGGCLFLAQKEFYIQFQSILVLGKYFFFAKREVQAFIKFLFKHFPEITQEDAFSVPFWGKAGKYIYLEQVKGNYKVGKFNVLFNPVLK